MNRKILIISLLSSIVFCCPLILNGNKLVISGDIRAGEYIDRIDIVEVEFSESCDVIEIPDYAFLGCTSLKKVTLSPRIKKIGFQAFSECSALEEISLPDSIEDIGSNSFAYCRSLNHVRFPSGLKHIGHNAFSFCGSLTEVVLPDSLEEIESYAFSDCDSLRKVTLPANGNMLGELIMNCCPALVEIIQPSEKVPVFDCNSYIFDPYDKSAYDRCVLKVPENMIDSYDVSKSWRIFNKNAMSKQ